MWVAWISMKWLKFFVATVLLFSITACERKDVAETADTAETGKAVIMQIWTTEQEAFFNSLAREFVAELGVPNLRFKVVSFSDTEEMKSYFTDQLAEDKGPDIIFADGEWLYHNTGKVLPVSADDETFTAEAFRATFVQVANEILIQNERIYGVPLAVETLALIFNEEHIADRLPESNLPARTWTGFKSDVEALTKEDNSFERFSASGVAMGRFDNMNYGPELLENLMLQMGVGFFDESGTQALFDKSQSEAENGRKQNLGVEALNFFTSFADNRFKHHSWNELLASKDSKTKDLEAFARGKTSMVFAYSQDLKTLSDLLEELKSGRQNFISDKNIRVAFLPQMEDPSISASRRVVGNVKALAVSRTTDYPDTAWRFLKFAIEKDNLQSWHEETLYPTPRVDMLVEQEGAPEIGVFVRQSKFAKSNIMPLPKQEFYDGLRPFVLAINEKRAALDKSLETLAKQITAKLQERARRAKEIAS